VSYFGGESPNSFLAADFNGDGIIDVAVASNAGLGLLLGKGDGTLQPVSLFTSPLAPLTLMAAGDLNGDGNADLVVGDIDPTDAQGPVIQVLLGNRDGTFASLTPTQVVTSDRPASLVDVNGDGKLDLVQVMGGNTIFTTPGTHVEPGVQVLLGNDDGTFAPPINVLNATNNNGFYAGSVAVGDFNHDGRPDILVGIVSLQHLAGVQNINGIATLLNTSGPAPASFLVSATAFSPSAVTPGNSATATVILKPVAGFSGDVALSCTGLPVGATCNFAPTSVTGASGTSALTITTTSSTPGGIFSIAVVGTAGAISQQRTLTFTVLAPAATLAPTSLTFAPQADGTTSSPQSVQLTNSGTAALAISTIAIAGTNAGEFAQTNNCDSSLAAGASCQINVTFTPTGMGARTAAISITDNAPSSPQMVPLTGSGPDFTMTGGTTTTDTIAAGQTATYTISVAPGGGFNQSVMLTCSGAPANSSCTI
jgi:FG-GAP-like repeat/Abnormal spindle-like microcephaly-assoc'd, ASPM-SPD-2-Hydin